VKLVTVAAFPLAHQAHLARALLEDAGIPAFVAGQYGTLFPADGGVQLRVPEGDVSAARAILQAADDAPDLDSSE
jgi:hypothetical protein